MKKKFSLYFYNISLNNYYISLFIGSIWFIPYLSTFGIIKYPLILGGVVVKSFDQGWSEYFGGQHLYSRLTKYSQIILIIQNNNLKIYLITFVLWVIILFNLIIFLYSNSLYLEYDTEDVMEIILIFEYSELILVIYKNYIFYFYNENVRFLLNYINRSINGI